MARRVALSSVKITLRVNRRDRRTDDFERVADACAIATPTLGIPALSACKDLVLGYKEVVKISAAKRIV
jgi:hypothetical protein